MRKIISFKNAINISLIIFSLTSIYHVLILSEIIPYSMTWGGRLESLEEMYKFEFVSLGLNLIFLFIVWRKAQLRKNFLLNVALWLMTILFGLNTLGNIFSLNSLEAIIFTPITLIASILCIRLAIEK